MTTQLCSQASITVQLKRGIVVILTCILVVALAASLMRQSRVPPTLDVLDLARMQVVARRTLPAGEYLPTANGDPATWALTEGFLHPERDGTWMAQLSARIQFDVLSTLSPLSASVEVEPLLAPSVRQRSLTISSTIDEVKVLLTGGRQTILVALDGEISQEIFLECSAVDAPIELRTGPDRRAFCAKLYGFQISAE